VGISGGEEGIGKANIVEVFVFVYENRTMKPVEIVLRRGTRRERRKMEWVNLIKTYRKQLYKSHSAYPYNYSTLIKKMLLRA
jgi:hypothetical protein